MARARSVVLRGAKSGDTGAGNLEGGGDGSKEGEGQSGVKGVYFYAVVVPGRGLVRRHLWKVLRSVVLECGFGVRAARLNGAVAVVVGQDIAASSTARASSP